MAAGRVRDEAGTASRILNVAERLVQVRGFNGFSYADIAVELQITKAALHYHFASKADLGEALIARYADHFMGALAHLDTGGRHCQCETERLRGPVPAGAAQPQDVPVRHARRRVPDPPAADPAGGRQVLRPERELAGQRPGAGPRRRQPAIRRLRAGHRPHDHGGPGRGDAHRPPLRRHHAIPGHGGQPASQPDPRSQRAGTVKPRARPRPSQPNRTTPAAAAPAPGPMCRPRATSAARPPH